MLVFIPIFSTHGRQRNFHTISGHQQKPSLHPVGKKRVGNHEGIIKGQDELLSTSNQLRTILRLDQLQGCLEPFARVHQIEP